MSVAASLVVARVLHVLGVVVWIGGVAFVTTVVIPLVGQLPDEQERARLFESLEARFAWQARAVTLLTGLSGFFMIHQFDAWGRYLDPAFWWVHIMTLVWLTFTLVLFVFEPLFLHRWYLAGIERDPERTFRLIQRMHWFLLTLSLTAIVGAVAGTRGFLRFG